MGKWTGQKLTPTEAPKKYLEIKEVPEGCEKVLLDYEERLICEAAQRVVESMEVGR
ncbi:hypothetical protein ACFLTN_03940 [Chloroflexota bacterium]